MPLRAFVRRVSGLSSQSRFAEALSRDPGPPMSVEDSAALLDSL